MQVTRRSIVLAAPTFPYLVPPATATSPSAGNPPIAKKPTFVNAVGSRHNPYDAWWIKGGELCAAAYEAPYEVIESGGILPSRGMNQLIELVAKTDRNMVLNLTAPGSPKELDEIVSFCIKNDVYFVTHNNLPSVEHRPWAFGIHYVAHVDFDHRLAGLRTARLLIAAMGGKGGILALGGKPTSPASIQRLAGLQLALSTASGCNLLAKPVDAEWAVSAAYDITRALIARHGRQQVAGIWAANDDMALGAVEALRVYKHPVPVTGIDGMKEALDAVQTGNLTATVAWDACWQGGIGLAMAYSAKMGLMKVNAESRAHRAFFGPFHIVTADNVAEFLSYRETEHPPIDWRNFWGRSMGAIPAS